jgi:hypothetical protein
LPQIGSRTDVDRYYTSQNDSERSNSSKSSTASFLSSDFNISPVQSNNDINQQVIVGLRLPNGLKKQKSFSRRDQIYEIVRYGLTQMDVSIKNDEPFKYTLFQMPNTPLDDLTKTIDFYNIENRSMFLLIEK